jgi:phytoene synthase
MSARILDAAGIDDPRLRAAYEACRRLHKEHGKTYYMATLLLPPQKRPHVWALYGFARYADEFVDSLTDPDPQALLDWGKTFLDGLAARSAAAAGEAEQLTDFSDPVSIAMAHTSRRSWSPCRWTSR